MDIKRVPISEVEVWEENPRNIKTEDFERLKKQIEELGVYKPLICYQENGRYITLGGNMRLRALKDLSMNEVDISIVKADTEAEKIKYALSDNDRVGQYDEQALAELVYPYLEEINLEDYRIDVGEPISLKDVIEDYAPDIDEAKKSLLERFIIPPFSIFDARQGYWQDRKRIWKQLLKDDADSRENVLGFSDAVSNWGYKTGCKNVACNESVFDPVLSEVVYKWFCLLGGKVLDPFAGGIIRGGVAELLGYKYTGIELRGEQIEINNKKAKELGIKPQYIKTDASNLDDFIKDKFDLIFTSPPYFNLEGYSNDEKDLSNLKNYEDFKQRYLEIIEKSCDKLNDDRFACFLVGEIRDKEGGYYNFISDTIGGFLRAGLKYYNEVIYIEALGTAAIRAGRVFVNRKITKVHQNLLVFYKGDLKKIKENYTEIRVDVPEEEIRATRQ